MLDKKGENPTDNEEGSCQANNINGIVPQKIIDKVLHTKYLYDHGNHNKHIEDPHIDACFIAGDGGGQHLIGHGHHGSPGNSQTKREKIDL